MALRIVYADPGGLGYHPVLYMVRLAAQLLDADLLIVKRRDLTLGQKLLGMLPRSKTGDTCLLICPWASHMVAIQLVENWQRIYGRLVAWVFDSFWTNHIPKFARFTRHFDQVFVTEQEDLEEWRRIMPAPVDWLPWGTDALGLGSLNAVRPVDLQRVGRQPPSWEDDASNAAVCQAKGIHFQGRPPGRDDAGDNQRTLMEAFSRTKFSLSFSNAVSPGPNTHPKREYITARWTDALAAGATVAGVPPQGETVRSLLWDGALLDLGTTDRDLGVDLVAGAARAWTSDRARLNHLRALERLDWRWRFRELQRALGTRSPILEAELAALGNRIASLSQSGAAAAPAAPLRP